MQNNIQEYQSPFREQVFSESKNVYYSCKDKGAIIEEWNILIKWSSY
jgi:hypothetical protein